MEGILTGDYGKSPNRLTQVGALAEVSMLSAD